MATKKKKKATAANASVEIHTEAMATLLAFANPPESLDPEAIARECVSAGLTAIGIPGPHLPDQPIDFGAIDRDSCIDFANSIELCVDGHGFEVPPLAGAFVRMNQRGTVITFGNLVAAIARLMEPKA